MTLRFIIKNFGKIESADISLSNLVVFVGNNHSGKTLVMQLIYGIRKELYNFLVPVSGIRKSDLNGQLLVRCDREWFTEVESRVNEYLAENKSRIIEDIFGIPISIGEIKVALEGTESKYFVSSISECRNKGVGEQEKEINIDTRQYENGENIESFENKLVGCDGLDEAVNAALQIVWGIILSEKNSSNSGQLFLPASRSGLQLMYKHYFAGETEGNLVVPVKDFLRFLQLYSENGQLDESRRALLEFGEEHLLQGKVFQKGDETFYVEHHGEKAVSLHIASSMIHELTPFVKALHATRRIDWLYCDEVENSLHPLVQGEMARWLIRMVNAGMHVMVSSHSDTMASRLNNLLMLTWLDGRKANYQMLSELGLKAADLLRPNRKADVYEFRNEGRGKTVVEKLEFISHPLMGYDFQLFGDNLDKLYNEAEKITR